MRWVTHQAGGEERGRLAFVLINRVNKIAEGYGTAPSIVLGAAIAHELGHLLISKEHSKTGLMKAYFNQSDFRKARQRELRLTADQARHIRNSSARVATSEDAGNPRAAADTEVPRLTIQMQLLGITPTSPADILESARQQVTAIYARAGIELIRHDTPAAAPSALRFAAKIVPHSLSYGHDKPHVMGAALAWKRVEPSCTCSSDGSKISRARNVFSAARCLRT